jgi:hypothetical protein
LGKKRELSIQVPGKRGLSAKQINEWYAYMNVEPFGEFRSELRHGQQMAMNANINRDSKTKPEPFNSLDFMNFVERPPEKVLTLEEIEAHFDKMFG